ncbi:50S ribosomal protein L10 [Candidatus Uhrbacteria bacterium]|nr:50S ribosomal protein L10 [Candidatus Uhrbacteria bacterium]
MPKTKAQKEQTLQEFTERLGKMKGMVLVDYKGLKVKDAQKIREASWGEGIDYEVVKKTLLKLALKNKGLENALDPQALEGNISTVVGYQDEVETAKFAAKFAKEIEAIKILGGLFEGKYISASQVKALAALPSRVELLARLVGTLNAPISGLVNVLAGNLRGLVRVLDAVRESKSS